MDVVLIKLLSNIICTFQFEILISSYVILLSALCWFLNWIFYPMWIYIIITHQWGMFLFCHRTETNRTLLHPNLLPLIIVKWASCVIVDPLLLTLWKDPERKNNRKRIGKPRGQLTAQMCTHYVGVGLKLQG